MSFSEIIIIAVVAVLVLGPEKLPSTLVELAKLIKGIKKQINEAKRAVEDEINIAELREEAERYKREIAAANESVRKRLSLEDFEQIGEQVRGAGEQLREGLSDARAAGASAFAAAAEVAEANVLPDAAGATDAGGGAEGGAGGAQVSPDAGDFEGRPERVSAGGTDGVIDEEICKNRQPGGRRSAWKQAALAADNDAANADSDGVGVEQADGSDFEANFRKNADIAKLVSGANDCGSSAANADNAAASDAQVSLDAGDFGFASLAELRCAPFGGRPERVSDGAGGVSEQAPGGVSAVREQISATVTTAVNHAANVDGNGVNSAGVERADGSDFEANFRKNADIEKLVGVADDCESSAAANGGSAGSSDCGIAGSHVLISSDETIFDGRPERVSNGSVVCASVQAPGGVSAVRAQISATSAVNGGAADNGNDNSAIDGSTMGERADGGEDFEANFRKKADIEKLVGAAGGCESSATATTTATTTATSATTTTSAAAHAAQTPTTQENPHA